MSDSAHPPCPLRLLRGAKFLVLFCLSTACGRPATQQECQEILRRAAKLELQERLGNNEMIESEVLEIEKSMHKTMMNQCVGKRITESALVCIRQAKTVDQLFGQCF